jgi:hypothetical protein
MKNNFLLFCILSHILAATEMRSSTSLFQTEIIQRSAAQNKFLFLCTYLCTEMSTKFIFYLNGTYLCAVDHFVLSSSLISAEIRD